MKYLFFAIINTVYGALLLLSLSSSTPGYFLVLIIGLVLTIIGLTGFVLWIKMAISANKDQPFDDGPINSWLGLVKSFDIVLVIGLLFRALIVQPFIVDGPSMDPNFHNNEIIMVDKISYRFTQPQRGDVIVFQAPKTPGDDYIKRVIGTPGETVVITKGKVFVNGFLLEEPYLSSGIITNTNKGTVLSQTLGPNQYFVLGDNRGNSSDSRDWGILPSSNIIGHAWLSIFPWEQKGLLKFPDPVLEKNQLLKTFLSTSNSIVNYTSNSL
jgi:signal peptidase I